MGINNLDGGVHLSRGREGDAWDGRIAMVVVVVSVGQFGGLRIGR